VSMPELDLYLLACGLLAGLVAGAAGGVLAGLAGLGGGLIYMPVFYALMPGQGAISATVMASMVAIVVTGLFSVRSHWRLGHVNMKMFRQLIPGLVMGASLGLWLTLRIPGAMVLAGLAVLDGWIAWDYGRSVRAGIHAASPAMYSGPVGYVSGMLGIGGGTMLVPLLRRSLPLRQAVGTSAMSSLAMAATAVTVNLALESGWRALLGAQLSFLAGAWLGILLILPFATGWSARMHAVTSESRMRMILRGLFAFLSLMLLAAAAWASLR